MISDRYIGEVILQLLVEAMASHPNTTKPLPLLRTEYILLILSSSTTHYVCFLLGAVYNNDHCFINRIPVSFNGASTYNKLSRIMMLYCCTHSSSIQWNHSYMIPEYDALYDLKRQSYYELVPFLSNQPGIDKLILGGDVTQPYVHQRSGWKNMHSIVVPGFNII